MTTTIIQHIEIGWEKDNIDEVPRKDHTSLRKEKQELCFSKIKLYTVLETSKAFHQFWNTKLKAAKGCMNYTLDLHLSNSSVQVFLHALLQIQTSSCTAWMESRFLFPHSIKFYPFPNDKCWPFIVSCLLMFCSLLQSLLAIYIKNDKQK